MSTPRPSLADRRREALDSLRRKVESLEEVKAECEKYVSKTTTLSDADFLAFFTSRIFDDSDQNGVRSRVEHVLALLREREIPPPGSAAAPPRQVEILSFSGFACNRINSLVAGKLIAHESLNEDLKVVVRAVAAGDMFSPDPMVAFGQRGTGGYRAVVSALGNSPDLENSGPFREFWELCWRIILVLDRVYAVQKNIAYLAREADRSSEPSEDEGEADGEDDDDEPEPGPVRPAAGQGNE